jgi:hypothetical protein
MPLPGPWPDVECRLCVTSLSFCPNSLRGPLDRAGLNAGLWLGKLIGMAAGMTCWGLSRREDARPLSVAIWPSVGMPMRGGR